jgi:hypothetical protein
MGRGLKKYVHHRGKIWYNTGRTDHLKRLLLVNWLDSSRGIVADADMVYNCSDEDIKAIKEILGNEEEKQKILKALEDAKYEDTLRKKNSCSIK